VGSLYYNPNTGKQVESRDVVREEKAAARTKKARQKPVIKRRKAIARGVAPAVARAQTPLVAPPGTTGRAPQPRQPRRPQVSGRDAFLAAFNEAAGIKPGKAQPQRPVSTAGVDLERLQLLSAGSGGRSVGGFLKNLGRGGVDILTSVPASGQLVGEGLIAPFANIYAGTGLPGSGGDDTPAKQFRNRVNRDLGAAAAGLREDYRHRWLEPIQKRDIGMFGSRFYDDPTPTILDVLGAKAVAGRSPNVVRRATRSIAPESRAGLKAGRALSTLSAEDRMAYAAARGAKILPGPGGRYRPPREIRSRVARDEPGKPNVGERVIQVPRAPYSGDVIARTRQKMTDAARNRIVPRTEAKAEARQRAAMPAGSRQAGLRERAMAKATKWQTPEAKYARYQKKNTLDIKDLAEARAEVLRARTMPGAASAIAKLKQDKDMVGRRMPGLSVEEAAFAMHRMDMLGEVTGKVRGRGGLTASQLLDKYIRTVEGGQKTARAAGKRTENATAQLASIKALRERPELLDLTDMSNPAVKRVANAVDESRRLGRTSQALSVRAGVITNATRKEALSRDSAIGVGGMKWGRDAIRDVTVPARRKTLGIKKAIAKAEAAGDTVKVRALKRDLANHIKATRGRIAAIKRDATKDTPELRNARAQLAEAEAALKSEKGKVASRATLNKLYSGGRISGRGERNLELAPKHKGLRHQPGQPTRSRDYHPAERGPLQPWQEYNARKYSRELVGKRPDEYLGDVPHPPAAPGFRKKGISSGQGKAYRAVLRGQAKRYEVRLKTEGGSGSRVASASRSRDRHFRHLRKLEREALGFTKPRRPELVGKKGVYVPDKRIDVADGYTGPKPGGNFQGPDKARRSTGSLKSRAGMDMNPNLVLHQAARATENYTGRISAKALNELLNTAAYIDPKTGKALTGDRLKLLSAADSERVRLVHQGNLKKALRKLDELKEGKFLDEKTVGEVFTDKIPDGARASDYVAISKDAADVWTHSMTRVPVLDTALNYWKGGLLALSPRWYVNNTFGLALQYSVMTGGDISAIFKANRAKGQIRKAMEDRRPNTVKDTMAADLTGGEIPKVIAFGFRTNAKFEETWRRAAFYNRAKRAIRDETGKFRSMSDAEIADAIRKMPEAKVAEIVRDVDFFIGNYRKFNRVEQNFLKRIIPFYSWLRVIARLTFVLPFRSPIRAAALATLETASTAGINPNDKALPYYARGALRVGDKAVPTWGLNPWQTLTGSIVAAGEESPSGALAQEALGFTRPEVQLATERATGINSFGRSVILPPDSAPYGQNPGSLNPISGDVSRQRPRISFKEAILQAAMPGQVNVLRKVSAGGDRIAYDQSETPDLIMDFVNRMAGGKRDESLYVKKSNKPKGRKPTAANVYSAWFGVPIYEQDDKTLTREAKKALAELKAEIRKRERAGR
jgi:hypothetical protein